MADLSGGVSGAASGAAAGTAIMPGWGTAIGGIVGGIAGIFGAGDSSGEAAAEAMERAALRMEARLDQSVAETEDVVDNYYATLDKIEAQYDPYDMTEAYSSFYEGVLQPMELEFDEFILPSIKSAYASGIVGTGAGQSGAAKEAELKAKQRLSSQKGQLLAGERQNVVDRNRQLKGDQEATARDRLSAGTIAPSMRAGQASSTFVAEQAAIETRYAADRSKFESILGIPSAIISGADAGQSVQDRLNKRTS